MNDDPPPGEAPAVLTDVEGDKRATYCDTTACGGPCQAGCLAPDGTGTSAASTFSLASSEVSSPCWPAGSEASA
eukprot:scaffold111751_cov57-Phaeocystis_antarctica.AAC.1